MSIQFGDILKHNNLLYPIVDINDVKGGLRSIATFSSPALVSEYASIPEKYRSGYSLLLETSTGTIYYLAGNDATNVSHWSPVGVGGNGYGVANTIPKWTSSSILGNSNITDNGDTIIINGSLQVIGTTSTISSENLLVKDPIILLAGSQSGLPTYDAGLFINRGSSNTQAFIWDESEKEFKFISTTSSATTSGNVSIGTYSSVRTGVLRVGTQSVDSNDRFVVSSSGGTVSLIVDENGNVGIGTTSSEARLDVRAQSALATDIAFRVRNSTDTRNFLVVNGAGDVYNNGASGVNTNTFFGENVGRYTTEGFNTAIGLNALRNNTTGGFNTAIGLSALLNNTTGVNNTAIGSSALLSNTTGASNTAIGISALYSNTTGASNTAIGQGALYSNTTGSSNTSIGTSALSSNTTGVNNTAIGLSALFNNTTGGSNTAIGENAGRYISGGSNHTITNNSIFIGYDTRALADNQTNQIVIGNQAIGLGSNSVVLGNDSIVTTALKGNVGIATTSPQARLDVRAQGALATDIAFRVRNSTDTANFLVVNGAGDVYNNGVGGITSNTFFGENVGRNSTGAYNTAIGVITLRNNTTGYSNTAIGASALYLNTTGIYNTVIGANALLNNTTGGFNTAIGRDAGKYISGSSNHTITNNSVFIGYDTRALADNQTNQIVIGNQAIGLGSNSVVLGNDSIVTTALKGNVGIATTSPQARLDVRAQGALATDIAFRVRNSTDTKNFLVVNGAGDVYNNGVGGITSNTFFGENVGRNTTGASNTAIGLGALQNNTTGASNTAIGLGALRNNTTGFSNIAIGLSALLNNTTGFSNTVIGLSALLNNTTGVNNTAIGSSALLSNTTGASNTAIGLSALLSNTTGAYNTAIGENAGRYISGGSNHTITNNSVFIGRDTRALADNQTNQIVIGDSAIGLGSNSVVLGNDLITKTYLKGAVYVGAATIDSNDRLVVSSGGIASLIVSSDGSVYNRGKGSISSNTVFGASALSVNTSGYNNTAIGINTLLSNTVGHGNTALGALALQSSTSIANTAVGSQALYSNTTGGANTAVGFESLRQNITSNNNTAVGYQTLLLNTTGSENVAIGYNALRINNEDENVAIGSRCLYFSTAGIFNVGIGSLTLYSNTTGVANTAIGHNSLAVNTIGNFNVAIGYQAGPAVIGATNSTNSIYIGKNAGNYSNGYNNEIIIGSTMSYGDNSVLLGNDSTTKTYLKGSVQLPTMTTAEINLVSGPTDGQVIYNTTLHQICFYNGSSWRKVTDSAM